MKCPHHEQYGIHSRCGLLPSDVYFFALDICGRCKAMSGENWPPKKAPEDLMSAVGMQPKPVELPHPDRCINHPKTLNYQGCCSERTWFCDKHGVVDLQTCRTCKDFEEDA